MIQRPNPLIDQLYQIRGKAEIVDGRIVRMSPTGGKPGWFAGRIFFSLCLYEQAAGGGIPFGDNVGFIVDLPNRQSFSPDVAWCYGRSADLDLQFIDGAPAFAVEVRSESDYTPSALRKIRRKIMDYFAAGTLVVWDVDVVGDDVILAYRADDPDHPLIFRRGEEAHAEPAVPGWRFAVDQLFK